MFLNVLVVLSPLGSVQLCEGRENGQLGDCLRGNLPREKRGLSPIHLPGDSSILSFSIFYTRLVSPASEQVIHSAGNFETPFLPRAIFSPSPDHLFNLLRVIEGRLEKPRETDVSLTQQQ